jgi:hypothetical protein
MVSIDLTKSLFGFCCFSSAKKIDQNESTSQRYYGDSGENLNH